MQTKYLKTAVLSFAAVMALSSCREQIEEGARFTFVGNTIATYLQETPECSHFVEILNRGGCLGLMKAYGEYTCFAPTNEGVESFLAEQSDIYWTSYEKHLSNPEAYRVTNTGITSPHLSELSDSMCGVIARNHILPKAYYGIDFEGSEIADANMNDRNLSYATGQLENGNPVNIIDDKKVIWEEETENGVVHILDGVVNPSSLDLPSQLGDYAYFSLFFEALNRTGYADLLTKHVDKNYTEGNKKAPGIYPNSPLADYPKAHNFGYTVFLETNEVLRKAILEETGTDIDLIEDPNRAEKRFDAFVAYCQSKYKEGMKVWSCDGESSDVINYGADLTDWRNPVNQFIGYHILDRKISYSNLVCHNIKITGFDSEMDFPTTADRTEYYVSMNNRIVKVTMPLNEKESAQNKGQVFLNYAPGAEHYVRVCDPKSFEKSDEQFEGFDPDAVNGALNVLDNVLFYDEDLMKGTVLNCIMRFDASALFSELTNNSIRWKASNLNSTDREVFIPHGYCERIKVYSDDTRLFYLSPHTEWDNYQGDELMTLGLFDFAYRLPPLPEGTYEIRMGYSASSARHLVQVYLDNEVTGLPVDLRITGKDSRIGWKDPKELETEDKKVENEKEMKNRGYLRGPMSFYDRAKLRAWETEVCLRVVIATKYLSDGSHWLRFKNVLDTDDGTKQFMHDYFEIVPMSYLRDESITTEEKRQ